MNKTLRISTGTLFIAFLFSNIALAAEEPGKDHPLVKRYTGSVMVGYDQKEYDAYTLILGPSTMVDKKRVPEKKKDLEGKVTRIMYVGPDGRSSLEVFRNYEMAFKEAGFETLFSCQTTECGKQFYFVIYDGPRTLQAHGKGALSTNVRDLRYMAAKKSTPNGPVYVSLFVAFHNAAKWPAVLLEIIETKEMDTGMVTVNADAMAEGIESTGHIALYGIYFDTNSADIKPESKATLQEMSNLLKQKPSLKLLVVGHTDNQGGYDYNMGLSEKRAASVVHALVSDYGIDSSRLKPAGVGYLAPVQSNDTEEGRAKNRRVELVKQ
jgi:OOP family OmpA-OmpF porin